MADTTKSTKKIKIRKNLNCLTVQRTITTWWFLVIFYILITGAQSVFSNNSCKETLSHCNKYKINEKNTRKIKLENYLNLINGNSMQSLKNLENQLDNLFLKNFNTTVRNQIYLRQKRDILDKINIATSKDLGNDTSQLEYTFSQGFIDLSSRDPVKEGAATLAFAFDTTGSMYDDLKQVIEGADKIFKTVLEKFERPIYNYVLVPFNDPGE